MLQFECKSSELTKEVEVAAGSSFEGKISFCGFEDQTVVACTARGQNSIGIGELASEIIYTTNKGDK